MKTNQLVTGRIDYTSKLAKNQTVINKLTEALLQKYNKNEEFDLRSLLSSFMSTSLVREVLNEVHSRKLFIKHGNKVQYYKSARNLCASPNIYRTADILEVASLRISNRRVLSTIKRASNNQLYSELKRRNAI